MTTYLGKLKFTIACSVVAAVFVLPVGVATAQVNPSSQQIIDALKPKPKPKLTRSLSSTPAAPAEQEAKADAATEKFVDTLRNRSARSLSTGERQQIASVSETRPRIDLEIKFEYNSASVSRGATADMDNLGKALSDPALAGSTFVLAGHTDGVGGDEYNQELSNRRADAVKSFLVQKFKLAPDHLVTAGFGKTRLKNADNPKAAENRRVEVVNMVEK
jgi:outer membrane protein OmpA-like peptidoglycan-associated protein